MATAEDQIFSLSAQAGPDSNDIKDIIANPTLQKSFISPEEAETRYNQGHDTYAISRSQAIRPKGILLMVDDPISRIAAYALLQEIKRKSPENKKAAVDPLVLYTINSNSGVHSIKPYHESRLLEDFYISLTHPITMPWHFLNLQIFSNLKPDISVMKTRLGIGTAAHNLPLLTRWILLGAINPTATAIFESSTKLFLELDSLELTLEKKSWIICRLWQFHEYTANSRKKAALKQIIENLTIGLPNNLPLPDDAIISILQRENAQKILTNIHTQGFFYATYPGFQTKSNLLQYLPTLVSILSHIYYKSPIRLCQQLNLIINTPAQNKHAEDIANTVIAPAIGVLTKEHEYLICAMDNLSPLALPPFLYHLHLKHKGFPAQTIQALKTILSSKSPTQERAVLTYLVTSYWSNQPFSHQVFESATPENLINLEPDVFEAVVLKYPAVGLTAIKYISVQIAKTLTPKTIRWLIRSYEAQELAARKTIYRIVSSHESDEANVFVKQENLATAHEIIENLIQRNPISLHGHPQAARELPLLRDKNEIPLLLQVAKHCHQTLVQMLESALFIALSILKADSGATATPNIFLHALENPHPIAALDTLLRQPQIKQLLQGTNPSILRQISELLIAHKLLVIDALKSEEYCDTLTTLYQLELFTPSLEDLYLPLSLKNMDIESTVIYLRNIDSCYLSHPTIPMLNNFSSSQILLSFLHYGLFDISHRIIHQCTQKSVSLPLQSLRKETNVKLTPSLIGLAKDQLRISPQELDLMSTLTDLLNWILQQEGHYFQPHDRTAKEHCIARNQELAEPDTIVIRPKPKALTSGSKKESKKRQTISTEVIANEIRDHLNENPGYIYRSKQELREIFNCGSDRIDDVLQILQHEYGIQANTIIRSLQQTNQSSAQPALKRRHVEMQPASAQPAPKRRHVEKQPASAAASAHGSPASRVENQAIQMPKFQRIANLIKHSLEESDDCMYASKTAITALYDCCMETANRAITYLEETYSISPSSFIRTKQACEPGTLAINSDGAAAAAAAEQQPVSNPDEERDDIDDGEISFFASAYSPSKHSSGNRSPSPNG